jgi:hypothetical protein
MIHLLVTVPAHLALVPALRNGLSWVASRRCAFLLGQRRRIDLLDDFHPAVYWAPLDSKRPQANRLERGKGNPHRLEEATSHAPDDHDPHRVREEP